MQLWAVSSVGPVRGVHPEAVAERVTPVEDPAGVKVTCGPSVPTMRKSEPVNVNAVAPWESQARSGAALVSTGGPETVKSKACRVEQPAGSGLATTTA